jgi:predicted  nucleic acid-binding Zn-ribbon protein
MNFIYIKIRKYYIIMPNTRNIFQQMSQEIKKLKEDNEKLRVNFKEIMENFDEETRLKYKIKANNEKEQLKIENTILTEKNLELEKEIQELRNKMANLQDLNMELLTNIQSRENSFLT